MPVPFSAAGVKYHLGAQEAHQPAPLDREALGHGDHQRIALLGADHGQPDAGVAAGRLDHGLAGLERAGAFGILDDAERQAVLHRAHWIECLDLGVEVDMGWRQLVDLDDWCVAHGFENVVVPASHVEPSPC
jgi:hypothetical protein